MSQRVRRQENSRRSEPERWWTGEYRIVIMVSQRESCQEKSSLGIVSQRDSRQENSSLGESERKKIGE